MYNNNIFKKAVALLEERSAQSVCGSVMREFDGITVMSFDTTSHHLILHVKNGEVVKSWYRNAYFAYHQPSEDWTEKF